MKTTIVLIEDKNQDTWGWRMEHDNGAHRWVGARSEGFATSLIAMNDFIDYANSIRNAEVRAEKDARP